MRGGLYIAAAAILGALLANLLLADPGYVAIRFAGRLVEMSAVTFLLLKIIGFLVPLRVSQQQEVEGLDITQHGEALQ